MPSRSSKARQYVMSYKRYMPSDPNVRQYMAEVDDSISIQERIEDLSISPQASRDKILIRTVARAKTCLEAPNVGLELSVKNFLLAMLNPILSPNSMENSPTRQGATFAKEVAPPSGPPQAEEVEFDDSTLLSDAIDVIQPIIAPFVPSGIADIATAFRPIVGQAVTPKVRARGKRSKKTPPPKSRGAISQALPAYRTDRLSPQVSLVKPCTNQLSYSDLKRDEAFVSDFQPLDEELPCKESENRMRFWQMHGTHCVICSWLTRFCYRDLNSRSTITLGQRKDMLTLHAYGTLGGLVEYCDVKEGMLAGAVFGDESVDAVKYQAYLDNNV